MKLKENLSKARKNYWHLLRRYPEVAARIGLTATFGPVNNRA
jgi:hypothetical protein